MSGLRIARGFALDEELLTKRLAILARTGGGKTYTAAVIAEEMVAAELPFVVLDPVGVWWSLRAAPEGKSRGGLPVYVFGGPHGDIPIRPEQGAEIADVVVDSPSHYVVDLSGFESKSAERRFATDFAERLYRRKAHKRGGVHLFVEEADLFAPQRPPAGDQRMLGAFETIVRRGRSRGIGVTLICQRPAVLNKNVLEQAGMLIVLQMTGPRDRKAIDVYMEAYGEAEERAEMMTSLATLGRGEAWVWEPAEGIFKRVTIRKRRTFDDSADGGAGEPSKVVDVDLDALRGQLSRSIEEAKANDPKVLRELLRARDAEVSALRAEVEELEKRPTETERVEVPVLTDEDWDELDEVTKHLRDELESGLTRATTALERIDGKVKAAMNGGGRAGGSAPAEPTGPTRRLPRTAIDDVREAVARPRRPQVTPPAERSGQLTGPQGKVLDALAWLEGIGFDRPTKVQAGMIAGYRVGKKVGGTFGNILGQLRAAGMIDYPETGRVSLTDAGRHEAQVPDIPRTDAGLQAAIFERLSGPEQRVLEAVIDAYPDPVRKVDAGAAAGYTVGEKVGGTFGNILGKLRSLGLVDYPDKGLVAATDVLFVSS